MQASIPDRTRRHVLSLALALACAASSAGAQITEIAGVAGDGAAGHRNYLQGGSTAPAGLPRPKVARFGLKMKIKIKKRSPDLV